MKARARRGNITWDMPAVHGDQQGRGRGQEKEDEAVTSSLGPEFRTTWIEETREIEHLGKGEGS